MRVVRGEEVEMKGRGRERERERLGREGERRGNESLECQEGSGCHNWQLMG